MRGAKLSLPLLGILLLVASPKPANGLCNLVNGTMARCHDLEDAKYIDTYDLETLKTSVSEDRLYPGIFRNLSSLRHLDLSRGDVERIDPGTFRSLPELRSLDLSHNKIASLQSDAFDGLKKLHSLIIRKNAFTEIPSAVLALKNLKILDLAINPLNCSCATLKTRDILVNRGVHVSKRALCSSPASLKSKSLLEPEVQVICMFEEQDEEMQMDEAAAQGSGEAISGDPFEDLTADKLDEEEHDITAEAPATPPTEVETAAPPKSLEVPIAVETAVPSTVPTITEEPRKELFFSEENDKRATTVPVTSSTKSASEIEPTKETDEKSLLRQHEAYPVEGSVEGSGEAISGDPFEDSTAEKLDEEEHDITAEAPATHPTEVETAAPPKSLEVPIAVETAAPSTVPTTTEELREELFFSEENDKRATTVPVTSSTESAKEIEPTKETDEKSLLRQYEAYPVEGSGEEEDLREGSGIEGSGTGVPPINWGAPVDESDRESTSSEPVQTSTDEGFLGMLWNVFAGTSAPPDEDNKKDLNLEEEEFINASSEPTLASSPGIPVDEKIVTPIVASESGKPLERKIDEATSDGETVSVGQVLDDAKSGRVRAEEEETEAEATDASPARQPKQGMGSYVVLAALLAVLGALLGFAAYKGDYCKKKRKRDDVEGGTELKDMTKSLLEAGNGPQPKISSNGNMENVPLVCTSPSDDSKLQDSEADGSNTRYSAVGDAADPVKPPRKSFVPHEEPEKALANGKSHQDLANISPSVPEVREPVHLRTKSPAEAAGVNGSNRHDSVSSLGTDSRESPSARTSPPFSTPTNGSLATIQGLARPPLSPGAQRVKITLQDNPDSVPKTPILITRTKAGENLVKTP